MNMDKNKMNYLHHHHPWLMHHRWGLLNHFANGLCSAPACYRNGVLGGYMNLGVFPTSSILLLNLFHPHFALYSHYLKTL